MCRPPGPADRAMIQIYFEAPHSDTDILGRNNTGDTHKHILTKPRSYPPKARGKPSEALHQQSFCSYSSTKPPVNSGVMSLTLAHVSGAQTPPGSVSLAHRVSSFQHPGLQLDNYSVSVRQFERSGSSTDYQEISGLPRPDTVIHVYHNPSALLQADATVDIISHAAHG